MKNLAPLLLSFILLLFLTPSAQAQIGLNKLKHSAGNAMGNALENQIEKEMNKAAEKLVSKYWDKVLGKYYSGIYEGDETGSGKAFPFIINANVKTEDQYVFVNAIHIEVNTYKKNGKLKESMQLVSHAGKGEYLGTEMIDDDPKSKTSDVFIINDITNQAMVMLMNVNGENVSMAYGLIIDQEALQEIANDELEKADYPQFVEIGTKTILGYQCKGYKTETDDATNEVWLTSDDVFGMENMFAMNAERAKSMPSNYPKGSIMEVTTVEKKNSEKVTMQVVKIEKSTNLVKKMSDYPAYNTAQSEE